MSVYTELLRVGVEAQTAREIAEAVRVTQHGLVTTRDLLLTKRALAEMETRILREIGAQTRTYVTAVIAMTGIFAFVVSVISRAIRR